MPRFEEYLDGSSAHMEYGMTHISYDADTERHRYRDQRGDIWETASGNRHGPLSLVAKAAPAVRRKPVEQHPKPQTRKQDLVESKQDNIRDWNDRVETTQNGRVPSTYQRRRRFSDFAMLPVEMAARKSVFHATPTRKELPMQRKVPVAARQRRDYAPRQSRTEMYEEQLGDVLVKLGKRLTTHSRGSANGYSRMERRATCNGGNGVRWRD